MCFDLDCGCSACSAGALQAERVVDPELLEAVVHAEAARKGHGAEERDHVGRDACVSASDRSVLRHSRFRKGPNSAKPPCAARFGVPDAKRRATAVAAVGVRARATRRGAARRPTREIMVSFVVVWCGCGGGGEEGTAAAAPHALYVAHMRARASDLTLAVTVATVVLHTAAGYARRLGDPGMPQTDAGPGA